MFFAVLSVLIILIFVIIIRTLKFTSRQVSVSPVTDIEVDGEKCGEHLAGAVRFKTISYHDFDKVDGSEFVRFREYLEKTYPNVHSVLTREVVSGYSLLYTWKGRDQGKKPVLLMAHMDVVPVEPGTEGNWTYPPFDGCIEEGYIWGRGSIDFKSGVIGTLEAVEILLKKGFLPERTIYLAFGHDEEINGLQGAANIVELLHSRGIELECVLDEGGLISEGILPGISDPIAMVGIAEKGQMSLELIAEGEGGHSSMPPKSTAVGTLCRSIVKLEENQMPSRVEGAMRSFLEFTGPEMKFGMRMLFANLWLFGPLVRWRFSKTPSTNATIRTTTASTMFEGSVKENVLPMKARAVVNFRIMPGDSIQKVIEHAISVINDPKVEVGLLRSDLASEPSVVSDTGSKSFKCLEQTIREIYPSALVAPYLVVGATDARYYSKLSKNVFRFIPLWLTSSDINRTHGTDERVSVKNFEQCIKFYIQFIKNICMN